MAMQELALATPGDRGRETPKIKLQTPRKFQNPNLEVATSAGTFDVCKSADRFCNTAAAHNFA
jgi:hypothetical protein